MPILKSTDNMEKRKGSDLNLVSALSNSLSSRHGSMPILRLLFFAFFEGSYFSRIDRSSMLRGAPSSCPIWRCSGRLDVRCCMKSKKRQKAKPPFGTLSRPRLTLNLRCMAACSSFLLSVVTQFLCQISVAMFCSLVSLSTEVVVALSSDMSSVVNSAVLRCGWCPPQFFLAIA